MRMTNQGHANLQYLRAVALQFVRESEDPEERQMFVDLYWDLTIRCFIARCDYAGAWHRTQLAALGEKAFEGPHRICHGHVEHEPFLTATRVAVMGYIHVLYHCLAKAGRVYAPEPVTEPAQNGWERFTGNGNPVADLMRRHRGLSFISAAMEVGSIVDSVNNRRLDRVPLAA